MSRSAAFFARALFRRDKPYRSALGLRRDGKLADRANQFADRLIVAGDFALELVEFARKLAVRYGCLAQLHEGAHDVHAGLDCMRRVEHRSGHQGAVLGECDRQRGGVPEVREVITVRDHLGLLRPGRAEGKIRRKTPGVSSSGPVQDARLD